MRKSTAGRILLLVITLGFTLCVGGLAFVWSLGNTISFTNSILLEETWGTVMGLVIQFGPQVFLALASTSSGTERTGWFAGFFVFSAVDAATNIGYTLNQSATIGGMTFLQLAVRFFIDIAIVFGEEMVGYGVSVLAHVLADLIEDFGEVAPGWMRMVDDTASRLSVGKGSSRGKQRRRNAPQQLDLQNVMGAPIRE